MFERYTEKARRVIFFSRYEACQTGSPHIETEHLLLGLMREDKALMFRFTGKSLSPEEMRSRIEEHLVAHEPVSTSVDLPLSNESKRVLVYAAEEAEQLAHKHIGTEHLFLGILREEKCWAAKFLREQGISLSETRGILEKVIAEGGLQRVTQPRPPALPVRLIAEDGSLVAQLEWQRHISRLPQIGEGLTIACDGQEVFYRIFDLRWRAEIVGDSLTQAGQVVLKVKAEPAPPAEPPKES